MKKICVEILSCYRWNYFQWFLLGFYKLQEQGYIEIKFSLPIYDKMLTTCNNKLLIRVADRLRRQFGTDSYNMIGRIIYPDGDKKIFCIDSADAPYLFDQEALRNSDVYFKMQCPIDLKSDAFALTERIKIPWLDHAHKNGLLSLTERGERCLCDNFTHQSYKIRPLMVGPRRLARGCSFQQLNAGFENYLKDRCLDKPKRLMCYFGNALGPKAESECGMGNDAVKPDFDWEGDIMGYFGEHISHPNEKRAKASDYISQMRNCDARVISKGNADSSVTKDESLIIPLDQFCTHISQFEYNFNVSGYRMSIPNRFLESFLVGTAIVTDKLAVRWYKPFDEAEVVETVVMGYYPNSEVDWMSFEKDIINLPKSNPQRVVDCFNEKWAPDVVARYIIDETKKG